MHNYKSIDGQKYAGFKLCVNVIKKATHKFKGKLIALATEHKILTNLSSSVLAAVTVGKLRWPLAGFFTSIGSSEVSSAMVLVGSV